MALDDLWSFLLGNQDNFQWPTEDQTGLSDWASQAGFDFTPMTTAPQAPQAAMAPMLGARGFGPSMTMAAPQAPQMPPYGQQGAFGAPQQFGQQGQGGGGRMPFTIPGGGVYGAGGKWLPGNGTDIFLPRGSPIIANQPGRVLLSQGGTGLGGGAEQIIQWADGTTTRFRHVQPMANGMVRPGQTVAVINDSSMDMLGPYAGMPDGFQHLDLSVNLPGQGVMFSPQGGGGGSANSVQWLRQMGYNGRAVPGTTRGPNGAGGMGGMGGFPGMGGGFPGMGGFPPMGGMGGFPGMMPPMMGGMPGGFGGMPPFMGGGFPGMMPPMMGGMGGMPPMPPFMGMPF